VHIGPYQLRNNVFVAPMAGVTDQSVPATLQAARRRLCGVRDGGQSDPRLWASEKTSRRINHDGEMEPRAVQIAGADPADAGRHCARFNVERGAQIIDINMGCPVKKVCNSWCGSALLQDEDLVATILDTVVKAVDVPVTLKFRTGWDRAHKNALTIARMAEDAGIAMLTLHGRTRADGYSGEAEYDTIAAVKAAVTIPVVANGDITTPEKARFVLDYTKADAVMIGRAAQGRPWIFREIDHYLRTGEHLPAPLVSEVRALMHEHLAAHYAFYGEYLGVRTARKHIGWYVRDLAGGETFRRRMNAIEDCAEQARAVDQFFAEQAAYGARLRYAPDEQQLAA
jgi:tRNA-dihydrouridine synthase B